MAVIRADRGEETVGTNWSDKIYGSNRAEFMFGNRGNDTIWGKGGDDQVSGGAGNDKLYGGSGSDFIGGETGRDTLSGGAGDDAFVFDTRLSRSNVDTITDYRPARDLIFLDSDIFKKAGVVDSYITGDAFRVGSKAHDSDDRIIYNKKTGAIYYDSDGTGSKSAVLFAKVDKNLKLSAYDFFVTDI